MIASDLITRIRYSLSDISKTRYTDTRLLILLNDAIRDIAKRTILFKEEKYLVISNLVVDYDLSSFVAKIVRAEYLDKKLDLITFEEMDRRKALWQRDYGDEVKAIVYNKQKKGLFKVYPIIENAQNDHIVFNQLNGIVTNITYSDILPVLADSIGDISDIPVEGIVKLYYIRKHAKITSLSDTIYIDDLVEELIDLYVTGNALLDNQDIQNLNLAKGKLSLYEQGISEYEISASLGFVEESYEVPYMGGI